MPADTLMRGAGAAAAPPRPGFWPKGADKSFDWARAKDEAKGLLPHDAAPFPYATPVKKKGGQVWRSFANEAERKRKRVEQRRASGITLNLQSDNGFFI